jgi:flagellar biosynthesis/type III secretory pathway protein FliH
LRNSGGEEWRESTVVKRDRKLIFFELLCSLDLIHTPAAPNEKARDEDTDMETLLTKEKADSIFAKIAKGLEEDKIVGCANMLDYAMKQAWLAGFEEGRKYPPKESK